MPSAATEVHGMNRHAMSMPVVGLLLSLAVLLATTPAQAASTPAAPQKPAATQAAGAKGAATQKPSRKSRFPRGGMPDSAHEYYAQMYGVDQLSVQLTDAGALVRFSFRVIDETKAQALQDRSAAPQLLDATSRAVLFIPVMDKIGPLRQSMPAKNGKSYWMAFSNKGGPVKSGHAVSVQIGAVRIDGLTVQ